MCRRSSAEAEERKRLFLTADRVILSAEHSERDTESQLLGRLTTSASLTTFQVMIRMMPADALLQRHRVESPRANIASGLAPCPAAMAGGQGRPTGREVVVVGLSSSDTAERLSPSGSRSPRAASAH